MKGKDPLPKWLIEIVKNIDMSFEFRARMKEGTIEKHSAIEMVLNWEDRKDKIFDFTNNLVRVQAFKNSVRGKIIDQLPQFSNPMTSAGIDNLSPFQLTQSPMTLALELLPNAIPHKELNRNAVSLSTNHDTSDVL